MGHLNFLVKINGVNFSIRPILNAVLKITFLNYEYQRIKKPNQVTWIYRANYAHIELRLCSHILLIL